MYGVAASPSACAAAGLGVELRIGSRPRNHSDVRDKIDVGYSQQLDELQSDFLELLCLGSSFGQGPWTIDVER